MEGNYSAVFPVLVLSWRTLQDTYREGGSCGCWAQGWWLLTRGAGRLWGESLRIPETCRGLVFSEQSHRSAVHLLGLFFYFYWRRWIRSWVWDNSNAFKRPVCVSVHVRNIHCREIFIAFGYPLWWDPGFHFLGMVTLMWLVSLQKH